MTKKFYIVNTTEFPIYGTHLLSNKKFAEGFKFNGYDVSEINSFNNIEDNETNIFLMANYAFESKYKPNSQIVIDLANKYEKSLFIGWYFAAYSTIWPFKKIIFTGEPFLSEPSLVSHKPIYNIHKSLINYIPYKFASSINPDSNFIEIANQSYRKYTCHYVGYHYRCDWLNYVSDNIGSDKCFIHIAPPKPFITGNEFANIFLSSKICIGFNSDANIANHVISERVFEGMSYGCLVLTDHPDAEIETNGATIYVNSKEDLLNKIKKYANNPDLCKKHINLGYEYVKTKGTYKHSAKIFLEKAKELYD